MLDPSSDMDLYCLHLVYKPKINEALRACCEWMEPSCTDNKTLYDSPSLMVGKQQSFSWNRDAKWAENHQNHSHFLPHLHWCLLGQSETVLI